MSAASPTASPPPARKRRRWPVLVVGAVVALAGISVLLLVQPPALTVAEGYRVGVIRGNLTALSSGNPASPRFDSFASTTYANQSAGPTSILGMTVRTQTWSEHPVSGPYWSVVVIANVTITARFARNIHPDHLTLACNGTGNGVRVDSENSFLGGTNVSYDRSQFFGFTTNGSGALTATPVSQGGTEPTYLFTFWDVFRMDAYRYHDGFYGFRATLTGFLLPPIAVEFVLGVADLP